jgi:uncharacterized protein YqjF (DUF2071 family)
MTSDTELPGLYRPECPISVENAWMVHRWDRLAFLHWDYDPDVVQALLPDQLRVETYGGRAWVGLVPFLMGVRPGRGPAVPWLSHFCETNVRTYVTAPDGSRGVWFFSLDAARLGAVVTARTAYHLPYFWSSMSLADSAAWSDETHEGDDRTVSYSCLRRWPKPAPAHSWVKVRVEAVYQPHELTDFDHYLTARWRLYSRHGDGLRYALAQHDPWPLTRARLIDLDDELVATTGLPAPTGDPICHWSPGVEVRIGQPHRLAQP